MVVNSDLELVKKYLAGDEQAFNEIVRKYKEKIYWHARRMLGNHLDADEITQEVIIVLYKKLKTFNFQSSLYTWIFKITSNLSINYINKRKIKKFFSFDDSPQSKLIEKSDIVKNYEDKEKLEILENALMTIPPKQREVFVLRHFEGLSYQEISEVTGKKVGTLKANYFHALNKILEKTKNEG
jgi:RNA polymerase sigma factor (sigma-70 family)